jgi:hypothetical protein
MLGCRLALNSQGGLLKPTQQGMPAQPLPSRTRSTLLMSASMRAKRCVASGSSFLSSSLPMKRDSRYDQVRWISARS